MTVSRLARGISRQAIRQPPARGARGAHLAFTWLGLARGPRALENSARGGCMSSTAMHRTDVPEEEEEGGTRPRCFAHAIADRADSGYAIARSRLVKSVPLVRDRDPLVSRRPSRLAPKYNLPCPRRDSPMTQRINTRHGESNRWLLVLPLLLLLLFFFFFFFVFFFFFSEKSSLQRAVVPEAAP
ncbi:PREDICTED: uncharacterized protein LOC105566318 isoform X1 [Vollenhovia emeryi]|uniref:uncharacterized protein LOC105566318 isoform X1 n=1 Tax=Vollenhovia emeryi TaxID=411798 RepID=UPI0005F491E9|nr:PREDICTED: uncharacterized protein LOC105566318 isoform X1 [Vollenhovia emeryi]